MSNKAIFHSSGVLVTKNEQGEYEPIEEMVEQIDVQISDKQGEIHSSKDNNLKQALKGQIKALEKEKDHLTKDAKKLIDLRYKTLILLDTPGQDLFNAIMSLLSHDKYEVEYSYVDTSGTIKTKSNILRGWPVVIFAQAIDLTHYERYAEIQRRFIFANPKMDKEKYRAAIDLMADKYSLPDFIYEDIVVSDLQKEQARELVKSRKEKILEISDRISPGKNNTFIPFRDAVEQSLNAAKAFDMTVADRTLGYLPLLATIHIEDRPGLVLRKEHDPIVYTYPFAIFEDLREALYIIQYSSGLRPFIAEWFDNVFLSTFEKKTEPDSKDDSRGNHLTEDIKALTIKELREATFEIQGKRLSANQIRKGYLEPLMSEAYIDKQTSNLNKSTDIFYPIILCKVCKSAKWDEDALLSQQNQLIVEDSALFPRKDYVRSQIEGVCKALHRKGFLEIKKIDIDNTVDTYYSEPERYFLDRGLQKNIFNFIKPFGNTALQKDNGGQTKEIETKEGQKSASWRDFAHFNTLQNNVTEQNDIDVYDQKPPPRPIINENWSNQYAYPCKHCDFKTNDQSHTVKKQPGKAGYG
jgi:hypothetical protein